MKTISITNANYVEGYKVELYFNDKTQQIVDFGKFLNKYPHPQYDKYKDLVTFKTFKIEGGNVIWGEVWDLIFPVWQITKEK